MRIENKGNEFRQCEYIGKIYIYVSEIGQERWKKLKKNNIFEHTLRSGRNERVMNGKKMEKRRKKMLILNC